VGVRHAKAERIPVRFSDKGRLSVRAIAKGQASWRSVQVVAEDGPEHSTGDDKVVAVSLKVKPFGPRLFIRSKVLEEALNL
jgi:hypothetical protein